MINSGVSFKATLPDLNSWSLLGCAPRPAIIEIRDESREGSYPREYVCPVSSEISIARRDEERQARPRIAVFFYLEMQRDLPLNARP